MKNEETAKRLKLAMEIRNITAKALSDKSGVSEPSISQYLHGVFAPRNITAGKLALALNVDPMWLMGFDCPMEKKTVYDLDFGTTFSSAIPNNILAYIAALNSDGLKKAEEYLADLSDMKKYKK